MSEAYKNLDEVTNLAIKTGEKIVTIDCPCCGKAFYVLESEAVYNNTHRNNDEEYKFDEKTYSLKTLGRKCPYCGFSGTFGSSDFLGLGKDVAEADKKAADEADEIRERNQASWAQICGQGVKFDD